MSSPTAYSFDRQRIVVADEDSVTAARIIATLRRDGHCVAHDPSGLSAPDSVALMHCHLMISSMRVEGAVRMDLLEELRNSFPALTILFLSNDPAGSTSDPHLPDGLPMLRTPFTTSELQAEVRRLLPKLRAGTILARPSEQTATATDDLDWAAVERKEAAHQLGTADGQAERDRGPCGPPREVSTQDEVV